MRELAPYFDALGVGDLYLSPIEAARPGSAHGYDVVDPTRVNPELGGREGLYALADVLAARGMGALLDVVPNHLAADCGNPWWRDVLANGTRSEHAAWFDIEWRPAATKGRLEDRVLLPVLGDLYGRVLERGELRLVTEGGAPAVAYFDRRFPLAPPSAARLAGEPGGLEAAIRRLNGDPADPRSFDALDALLAEQPYRLAHWRLAAEEINYRRFFDVADLVSLRVEEPRVFAARHQLVGELLASGRVTGLRIDHVDGLYDPAGYLERVQAELAPPGGAGALYLVVEKILGAEEELPEEWPVAGTTGYKFLNRVSALLVRPEGLAALERIDRAFTGRTADFAALRREKKKQVLAQLFGGELRRLAVWLGRLAAAHRDARDLLPSELAAAIVEVTAELPVYGTYVRGTNVAPRDREVLERTFAAVAERTAGGAAGEAARAALGFLRQVLLLAPPPYLAADATRREWSGFVMRWQELTGPVTAKGVEDTALYLHQRLVSLNEVGGEPDGCGPCGNLDAFHRWVAARAVRRPHGLNATSTHDTKRSEDVRARLHVLSELAPEWEERLARWSAWNRRLRRRVGEREVPAPDEESLLYQTLLGVWPLAEADLPGLRERLAGFLVKAAREAKERTSWLEPRSDYEEALCGFAADLLEPPAADFLDDFRSFQARLAFYGAVNGLTQLLIKLAAPGVPDFYQGTELWDFSLVDPDNRRAVDYERRWRMLEELGEDEEGRRLGDLLERWRDGGVKLFVTWKGLTLRRERAGLFRDGLYLPLSASGEKAEHLIAFARRHEGEWVVAAAPRWTVGLVEPERWPLGAEVWGETEVLLPGNAPVRWRDRFTGEEVEARGGALAASDLLGQFPVALLVGQCASGVSAR